MGVKWAAIRRMIKKEGADMICLQETKKEAVDKAMCQALWGDVEVCWEMLPANNIVGGVLCLWSETTFRLQSKLIGNGFIHLAGEWIKEAQHINLVTVYSPCDIHNKRLL